MNNKETIKTYGSTILWKNHIEVFNGEIKIWIPIIKKYQKNVKKNEN